ncbi:MAG: sulfatase [Kiritimatiellales bacterium]|nr:sulfatase [Kiritimatiellales bacterium]
MQRRCFIQTGAVAVAGIAAAKAAVAERPNILWLTSEDDNVGWVGCYGNPHAETPNIDKLAAEGFQYMHAYANAPVCAPSRSTWITGIHAISMGTHPMRSRYEIPHGLIKYYPDHLRANGYYCGNTPKTDYNIGGRDDKECWNNPQKVDWAALKQKQPFFQVINSNASHESKAQGDVENTLHDPADTQLRKYHPDLPDVRKNYAKYHDAMKTMDAEIGASLQALEAAGLAGNTIVVQCSDHGGVMPRSKRFLFDSGLHCPLIIRIPEKFKALWPAEKTGMKIDRLVSFIDMPKTWLSLTGSNVPGTMQGTIFLGPHTEPEKEFHFAFRGRMDERIDNARAVCDKQFLYIRNYMPYVPWMQHLNYLWKMKATVAWDEYVTAGKASEVEARFFAPKRWTEELYDNRKDPDNVDNLIQNPEYRVVAARMRAGLRSWQETIFDAGLMPESEMVKRAAANHTTIYEMVRNPKLYNLPALINAADVALAKSSMTFPMLMQMIKDPDCGIRYWGAVGCFLVTAKPDGIDALLEDESHEVRAMAAWLLIKTGEKEKGLACMEKMLKEKSYATLSVLNIIDWMGDDGQTLIPLVQTLKLTGDEKRMQADLQTKQVGAPAGNPEKG